MARSKDVKFIIFFTLLIFCPSMFVFDVSAQKSTIKLLPIDDAHLIADLNRLGDVAPQLGWSSYRDRNADFETLNLMYAWNTTEQELFLVTIPVMKFNLTDIESENVQSANLKMYPTQVALNSDSRKASIYPVESNDCLSG